MEYSEIIKTIARKHGTTPAEVEAEMQAALEVAKDNPNFKTMLGNRKPTVEEFVSTVSEKLRLYAIYNKVFDLHTFPL